MKNIAVSETSISNKNYNDSNNRNSSNIMNPENDNFHEVLEENRSRIKDLIKTTNGFQSSRNLLQMLHERYSSVDAQLGNNMDPPRKTSSCTNLSDFSNTTTSLNFNNNLTCLPYNLQSASSISVPADLHTDMCELTVNTKDIKRQRCTFL